VIDRRLVYKVRGSITAGTGFACYKVITLKIRQKRRAEKLANNGPTHIKTLPSCNLCYFYPYLAAL
jgi:hypothetical protein